jgi:hypothetical protein
MSDACTEHGRMCERIDNLVRKLEEYITLQRNTMDEQKKQRTEEIELIHERIDKKEEDRKESEERLEAKVDQVNTKIDALKDLVNDTIRRTLVWTLIFVGGGLASWVVTQVVRLVMERGGTP